ncbi:MAG: hypothetical protein H7210_14625 [Pyrinomonadaceae bacterium]|nr:hypothetical protein [Phycisphaerales bacterium]
MIFLADLAARIEQHARASASITAWGTLLILAIGLGSAFVVMLRHLRALLSSSRRRLECIDSL